MPSSERGLFAHALVVVGVALIMYWAYWTIAKFYTPNAPPWFFWGAG